MNTQQLYCQSLKFNNIDEYLDNNKIFNNKQINFIEFRVDSLLFNNYKIDEIIYNLNKIKTKQLKIFTIRTDKEGGEIELKDNDYIDYLIKVIETSNCEYIDIEYQYYKRNKNILDYYIELSRSLYHKKIIFSSHILNNGYDKKYYEDLIIEMNNKICDIIKIASKPYTKDDVFNIMDAANIVRNMVTEKKLIIISMGTLGLVSRVFTEYTNSYFTFIDQSVDTINEIGQCNINYIKKLRKLL